MTEVMTEERTGADERPQVDVGGANVPPRAVAMPWDGDGAWAVVVPPDSDVASLAAAARRVPSGYRFVESFGDVETTLVYGPAAVVSEATQEEEAPGHRTSRFGSRASDIR